MTLHSLPFLRLLQLADSALPIGGAAHSFGLETLVAEGRVTVENLPRFLADYLEETGVLEAAFCMSAATEFSAAEWVRRNQELSALRPAEEARNASVVLGRRFLQLASTVGIEGVAPLSSVEVHLCAAFGHVAGLLGLDPVSAATAYLHQSLAAMVSASQRLMPLGQHRAARILWDLKPGVMKAVAVAKNAGRDEAASFAPAIDIASMQHPHLTTRLFIS